MTRSAARRSTDVQAEKSPPPASSDNSSGTRPPSPPTSNIAWTWRLAMFLWITSFGMLLLYEWLAGVLKMWSH